MTKINELSKELLTRYVRKAAKSSIAHTADNSRMIRSGKKDDRTYTHNLKIEKKRDTGVNRAMKSIAREETINELSKDKLRSYIAASRKDAVKTITSPVNLSDRSKNNPGNWRRIEKRTAGSELAKKKFARESAELADIGMAAMGAMAAHSVIHHATGAMMHSTGHHLKNLVSKIKTKLGSKTAKVAGTTATKPSSVDKPAANDNAPKALPKVKTTITHSEETLSEWRDKRIGSKAFRDLERASSYRNSDPKVRASLSKDRQKRAKDIASGKLKSTSKGYVKAEETVNELSKGLLGRYLNKARADHKTHSRIIRRSLDDKKVNNAVKNNEKRNRGMYLAQQKLQTPAKIPASEETQPNFNEIMLARSRRLGIANQISYYENAVKNEHRYTDAEQRKLDQDSGKDLDRQARKLAVEKRKAKEQESKK